MIKEEVLSLLENSGDEYLSGSVIATKLGVSRTAVWKAVASLEREGYRFEKSTKNGYKLKGKDGVSSFGVKHYLRGDFVREVECFEELASTNSYLMEKGAKGEKEGLLVVSKRQTSGRGRRGKNFFSPDGGVYFSLLLRPKKDYVGTAYLTVMTALAVMEGITEVYKVPAGIKWVNDVYIGNKKCAGILTEASIDFESGSIAHAVIGVGINLFVPEGGYPEEIKEVACAIGVNAPDAKNKLIATVFNKILDCYYDFDKVDVVNRYKAGSIMEGKKIIVKREEGDRNALCLGMDDACRLIVRYDNGEEETLYFGEVSLCLKGWV